MENQNTPQAIPLNTPVKSFIHNTDPYYFEENIKYYEQKLTTESKGNIAFQKEKSVSYPIESGSVIVNVRMIETKEYS